MKSQPLLLFSTPAYEYMRERMCRQGGFEIGEVERRHFPDGERYMRIVSECGDRDIAIVGGTVSDVDTLDLYDLACSVVKYGARRLTLVIPFFGYSTMERVVRPGEVVTAKTRARLLSSIPNAAMGNRAFLVDLHVDAITYYFEGETCAVHVYAKPVIQEAARRLGGQDFVLACTDAGRAKWVESLANDLGVTPAFVYKRRLDGERTEVTGVSAHVRDCRVVIYDDMIRTGGSLLSAAQAYLEAGASSVAALTTHGVFPGDALERLERSGLLTEIICTDSHPRAEALRSRFLSVESVAGILVDHLREPV